MRSTVHALRFFAPLALVLASGCASARTAAESSRTLTVVMSGDERSVAQIGRELESARDLPVTIRRAELPRVPPPAPAHEEIATQLAQARRRYVDADFAACLSEVGDDVRVNELVGDGRRDLATRLLFWRIACHVGAGAIDDAQRAAQRFAVLGFEVPTDVESASPEVESVIANAQRAASQSRRTEARLSTSSPNARFSIDGRAAACGSPCVVDLPAGDHVVRVEADGEAPLVAPLRVEGRSMERTLATTPAAPLLSGAQWSTRYAGSPFVDSSDSLRLLSRAVRAQDLLYLAVDEDPRTLRLRATYAVDGTVRARAERSGAPTAASRDTRGILRDVLVRSGVVVETPIVRSPIFWSVLGGATVAAVVITAILVAPAPTQTQVSF